MTLLNATFGLLTFHSPYTPFLHPAARLPAHAPPHHPNRRRVQGPSSPSLTLEGGGPPLTTQKEIGLLYRLLIEAHRKLVA